MILVINSSINDGYYMFIQFHLCRTTITSVNRPTGHVGPTCTCIFVKILNAHYSIMLCFVKASLIATHLKCYFRYITLCMTWKNKSCIYTEREHVPQAADLQEWQTSRVLFFLQNLLFTLVSTFEMPSHAEESFGNIWHQQRLSDREIRNCLRVW